MAERKLNILTQAEMIRAWFKKHITELQIREKALLKFLMEDKDEYILLTMHEKNPKKYEWLKKEYEKRISEGEFRLEILAEVIRRKK